jgi:hypothetical protein
MKILVVARFCSFSDKFFKKLHLLIIRDLIDLIDRIINELDKLKPLKGVLRLG